MFTEFFLITVVCLICFIVHQIRILIPINRFLNRSSAAIDLSIIACFIGKEQLIKEGVLHKNGNTTIKADVYTIEIGKDISEKEMLIRVVEIIKDAMKYAEKVKEMKHSENYELLIYLKREIIMQLWEKHGVRPIELA